MCAEIEVGHSSASTIFWEERTHKCGLPMLVVSLTTTEPLLLDHKFKSCTKFKTGFVGASSRYML